MLKNQWGKISKKVFRAELIFFVFINKGRTDGGNLMAVILLQFAPCGVLSFAP